MTTPEPMTLTLHIHAPRAGAAPLHSYSGAFASPQDLRLQVLEHHRLEHTVVVDWPGWIAQHLRPGDTTGLEAEWSLSRRALRALADDAPEDLATTTARVAALHAVLMWFCAGPWGDAEQARWNRLTAGRPATSVGLCNTVRAALSRGDGSGESPPLEGLRGDAPSSEATP
jgi:hypothetical protein